MDFTPSMVAALSAPNPTVFLAGELNLKSGVNVRLLDGSGALSIDGKSFTGRDDTFGTIGAIDAITDGEGDTAPSLSITLLPPTASAAASLSAAAMQGSRIRVYFGVFTPAGPEAATIFDGELDVPSLTIDRGTREVSYDCTSAFERFFRNDEGIRLSNAFHTEVWPGETGFANVTGTIRSVIWGPGERPGEPYGSTFGGSGGGKGRFEGGLNAVF